MPLEAFSMTEQLVQMRRATPEAAALGAMSRLLRAGHPLVVAFSGGKDSSTLANLALNAWLAARQDTERLPPLDLQRWDHLAAGDARDAAHRRNLLTLMLAQPASATPLAVALHAANVERDRLRRRRLMLTDALLPVLAKLRCPLHGIWGAQDVLYAHRLPLIGQVLSRAPGFVSLELLPKAGHWVQFEAAEAFDAALAGALGLNAPCKA